jgi:phenylpropionate dioxygenase-like ring-hydroxylating dioxygenase large terminal subunit
MDRHVRRRADVPSQLLVCSDWNREVGHRPLARAFLDEAVVPYRKKDGTPVALADRC